MIMFSLGYSCFNNPSMNSYPKINGSDMTKITKTLGKVLLDGNISFDSLTLPWRSLCSAWSDKFRVLMLKNGEQIAREIWDADLLSLYNFFTLSTLLQPLTTIAQNEKLCEYY